MISVDAREKYVDYKMNMQITSSTYIRKLNFSILRKLSDFLDPDDRWKEVIVLIMKPSGEPRYTQIEVR